MNQKLNFKTEHLIWDREGILNDEIKVQGRFCKYCKLWEFAHYRDFDILPVLGKNSLYFAVVRFYW